MRFEGKMPEAEWTWLGAGQTRSAPATQLGRLDPQRLEPRRHPDWVARSDHDILWRCAGYIGNPAWRSGTGGSDQNQQSNGSHVGMMQPHGNGKQVKTR